jgi:O-succinylbenzoic acid--CoA ligase
MRSLELGTELLGVEDGADFTAIVPTQLHRALNGDVQLLEHLQHAKAVLVGGAATSPELQEQAAQNDIHLVTTYGMTEMSGGCVYNGHPLRGVDVQISDGAIELNGPMKAIGYLGDTPFGDSFFRTSDAGRIENGRLEVIGRIDDQIITGGEKLSLGAVTDFLNVGSTQRFIAIGLPDAEWGQALAIASDGPIDESAVKSALRGRFGAHASPKRFAANIELPLTALGKPDRRTLAEIFGRLP